MKPILFNTEMVRAILDGRKTVTRRVVKPQPTGRLIPELPNSCWPGYFGEENTPRVVRPPYFVGDILYVRETWTKLWYVDPNGYTHYDQPMYYYAADGTPDITLVDEDGFEQDDQRVLWHPSIHMPKEAARMFLRVTDVRVERVQGITEEQAVKEGIYQRPDDGHIGSGCWTYLSDPYANDPLGKFWSKDEGARNCFRWLWDSTIDNADRSIYGWDADPWVWVIEFERITEEEAEND